MKMRTRLKVLRCQLLGHKIDWLLEIEVNKNLTYKYGECSRCPMSFCQATATLSKEDRVAVNELMVSLE